MNNKGFTLVELLAVVVITGLVMGIATYGIVGTIQRSRDRNEEMFVEKIGEIVDEYIAFNGSSFAVSGNSYCVKNCSTNPIYAKKINANIGLNVLVQEKLVDNNKFVNPVSKKRCLDGGKNPSIVMYRDDNYVYYYYVDLSGDKTSCNVSSKNDILSTMTVDLVKDLKNKGVSLPNNLKEKYGVS